MRFTLLALGILLAACGEPLSPSMDCATEQSAVRFSRGRPDSTALNSNQVADHPVGYYERWYYHGSPLVETFSWGALLPYCIYDQEEHPELLYP